MRRVVVPALVAALVVVPLVELYVLIQVGQVIGAGWTVLLLIADSLLGGYLLRREGRRTWAAFRDTSGRGALPAAQVADGALVVLGGALMLTPGFVTDGFGLLCVLPPTRVLLRRALLSYASRRVLRGVAAGPGFPGGFPGRGFPGGGFPGGGFPSGGFPGEVFPGPGPSRQEPDGRAPGSGRVVDHDGQGRREPRPPTGDAARGEREG